MFPNGSPLGGYKFAHENARNRSYWHNFKNDRGLLMELGSDVWLLGGMQSSRQEAVGNDRNKTGHVDDWMEESSHCKVVPDTCNLTCCHFFQAIVLCNYEAYIS